MIFTLVVLAASPLVDCAAQPYGRSGELFRCKNFIGTVQQTSSVQNDLNDLRDAIPELTFTADEVVGDDVKWKGSFQVVDARVVGCFDADGKQCATIAKYLAATDYETLIDESQPSLDFAGTKLKVPSGCDAKPPSKITCDGVELAWNDAAQTEKAFKELFAKQKVKLERAVVKCSIGGVATSCTRFTVSTRSQFSVLLGSAVIRGKRVVASCNGGSDDALPAICAAVFTLR